MLARTQIIEPIMTLD